MGSSVRKIKGGKLLRVRLEQEGSIITAVAITGDFFVYPEEGLGLLEQGLIGARIDQDSLTSRIASLLRERSVAALGFGPADLATAIVEAR